MSQKSLILLLLIVSLAGCGREDGPAKVTTAEKPSASTETSAPDTPPAQTASANATSAEASSPVPKDKAKAPPAAPYPVDPLRAVLIENIKTESIFESIDNLANFDDWSEASFAYPYNLSQGSYTEALWIVPRLSRVRRVLEEYQPHRREVLSKLKVIFAEAMSRFPQAYREHEAALAKGSYSTSEPNAYKRCIASAGAGAYLLAELGCHETLPDLVNAYATKEHLPTHPAFLLYAMHQLAVTHPRDGLSRKSLATLDDYLREAKRFPVPVVETVAGSKSPYNERDLRTSMLNMKLPFDKQPRITIRNYPRLPFVKVDFVKNSQECPELDVYYSKLRAFANEAY